MSLLGKLGDGRRVRAFDLALEISVGNVSNTNGGLDLPLGHSGTVASFFSRQNFRAVAVLNVLVRTVGRLNLLKQFPGAADGAVLYHLEQ
ncbi:hypothetical protein PZ895_00555 [Mesorhizobium sp. YIM 152430]|uniref:hypothetical protein n=1 Tax=Mesorhizobium sp. YIM 152430 TaxID=3031761 RepID=UPI0023DCC811|nr:hypothetical protein [Mesorhizobium sp. YIM 152430]MDF1598267.1 hypothetical protein [Mesorhizobium sp. YIM 152430]